MNFWTGQKPAAPALDERERLVAGVMALSDPPKPAVYRRYLMGQKPEALRQKLEDLTREQEADPYHRRLGTPIGNARLRRRSVMVGTETGKAVAA